MFRKSLVILSGAKNLRREGFSVQCSVFRKRLVILSVAKNLWMQVGRKNSTEDLGDEK